MIANRKTPPPSKKAEMVAGVLERGIQPAP